MAGAQSAWGLDVGITSLKAMKLQRDGDKVLLEAFDVVEHDTFLSEPDVDKDEIIRSTMRKFLERNPIRREQVFVGVPGSSTFARFVKLPPVDPKKIPEIVRFEAIQQIPFPLDQVNWDYQTFANPDSPEVEVGIFAMKKELVGQVLSNFRALGMTVHGVQMSPLAVYNAASYDGLTESKGTVLIDMGAEHTDLVIMDQGRLWLRTVNLGGNHFTDALAKSFKQPFSRAEQLKKTAATSKYQKQIFQAMRPIFADLVGEIQRSLGYYNSSHRDSRLERIIGMGNPFKLPNLQKYLQQELKMEVIRLDAFRKMTADARLGPGLAENILPLTASYGLALQALGLAALDTNLLPVEIARQMLWKKKRSWFYGTAAAVLVGVGALGWQYQSAYSAFTAPSKDQERKNNDKAIGDGQRRMDNWRRGGSTFEIDRQKADSYLKLSAYRAVWPMIYKDLLSALPQGPAEGASTAPVTRPAIVILAVDSDYQPALSTLIVGATPAAGGGAMDTGRSGMGSAGATSAVPDDHGFLLTIRGYIANGGDAPWDHLSDFSGGLEKLAPKQGDKPYFFERIPTGWKRDVDLLNPWGASKGQAPFWNEFAEDIAGIDPANRPKPDAASGASPGAAKVTDLQDVDLFRKSATGEKPGSMKDPGVYRFILSIKVHIRDNPKQ